MLSVVCVHTVKKTLADQGLHHHQRLQGKMGRFKYTKYIPLNIPNTVDKETLPVCFKIYPKLQSPPGIVANRTFGVQFVEKMQIDF